MKLYDMISLCLFFINTYQSYPWSKEKVKLRIADQRRLLGFHQRITWKYQTAIDKNHWETYIEMSSSPWSSPLAYFLSGKDVHRSACSIQHLSSARMSQLQNWHRSQFTPSFFLQVSFAMCSLISLISKATPHFLQDLNMCDSSHSVRRWSVNSRR